MSSSILLIVIECTASTATPTVHQQLVVDPSDQWTSLNRTEFTQNLQLELVSIDHNHILTLGTNLAAHSDLLELRLNDNPHFDLKTGDVDNLHSSTLQALHLSGCHLDNIVGNAFAGLPQLRELHLDRNVLKMIPVNMLVGTNVSSVSLSDNEAFNMPTERPVLNSTQLVELRCNRCGITRIYSDTFVLLPALQRLELNGNRIAMIYPSAFDYNNRLAVIHLNDNRLSSFPLEALHSPQPLQQLCVDGNNFTASVGTTRLKLRYIKDELRGDCPSSASGELGYQRLDDVEDSRLPGISDAFIAVYLVMIVLVQTVAVVVLVLYYVRRVYVRRTSWRRSETIEFDYAAGVVNECGIYVYVR